MTNFEFKARLHDAERVRNVMRQRRAEAASVMLQTDTYFRAPQGRLKLREIAFEPITNNEPSRAELIFYRRENEARVKRSDYLIAPTTEPRRMCEVLAAAFGTRVVVAKRRELYLLGYRNKPHEPDAPHIRVHLDQVEHLGNFVEVEAVVGEGIAAELAQSEAQALLLQLGVAEKDLIHGSYSDLLEERKSE
jgi:adenylate cyclase class IV